MFPFMLRYSSVAGITHACRSLHQRCSEGYKYSKIQNVFKSWRWRHWKHSAPGMLLDLQIYRGSTHPLAADHIESIYLWQSTMCPGRCDFHIWSSGLPVFLITGRISLRCFQWMLESWLLGVGFPVRNNGCYSKMQNLEIQRRLKHADLHREQNGLGW